MNRRTEREGQRIAPEIDLQRQRFMLLFVSYVTSSVMLVFGINSLQSDDTLLPVILFVCIAAFLGNIVLFHRSGKLLRACHIESTLVVLFVIALVYHGGYDNTALYWVFPFPALLFGLLGIRHGLVANILVTASLCVVLYWPDLSQALYRDAEKGRFIAALLIVIATCWLNEFGRARSLNSMDDLQQHKEALANTDALTRLANRRFIDHALPRELAQHPQHFFPLAVITCDLDHFKRINDEHGHEVGDLALKHIAHLLSEHLRQQDIACRYGGEEFLLLLPRCHEAAALRVAEELRVILEQHPFTTLPDGRPLTVTGSFGVSLCGTVEQLGQAIREADRAMYAAKHAGRNQVG